MSNSSTGDFLNENYGMLRFFSTAMMIYGAFYLFYSYVIIDSKPFDRYLELSTFLGAELVDTVAPQMQVKVHKTRILMTEIRAIDRSYVRVAQGCDASTVFAVLIATLLSWPGRWRSKIPALMLGLGIMYALNIVRIAGMSITEFYIPDYFDLMHEWILPPLLVVGALLYFWVWTLLSGQHPADIVLETKQ